jgi:hypothetical protein
MQNRFAENSSVWNKNRATGWQCSFCPVVPVKTLKTEYCKVPELYRGIWKYNFPEQNFLRRLDGKKV